MDALVDFIKDNYLNIIIIIVVMIILLVIISIKNINLNEPVIQPKLIQEVTVETFTPIEINENINNFSMELSDSFCKNYLGNASELETVCNELTEKNCASTKCCIQVQKGTEKKCVAGDIHGPTYKTDKNGKLITMDTYYYLGKQQK